MDLITGWSHSYGLLMGHYDGSTEREIMLLAWHMA